MTAKLNNLLVGPVDIFLIFDTEIVMVFPRGFSWITSYPSVLILVNVFL